MANLVATTEDMTTVADAIRTKGGTSAPLSFPDEFASAIQAIPGPKPEQEKEITISENGDVTITPDIGKLLSKVLAHVNVSGGGGGFDPAPFKEIIVDDFITGKSIQEYNISDGKKEDIILLAVKPRLNNCPLAIIGVKSSSSTPRGNVYFQESLGAGVSSENPITRYTPGLKISWVDSIWSKTPVKVFRFFI